MDHVADLDAPCTVEELFAWVSDLARYPSWLGIVERAEPVDAVDGDALENGTLSSERSDVKRQASVLLVGSPSSKSLLAASLRRWASQVGSPDLAPCLANDSPTPRLLRKELLMRPLVL